MTFKIPPLNERPRVWGLTGGIASGKSVVARLLQEMGIFVVDADQVGKDLLEKNPQIRRKVDEALQTTDRKKLRQIIFEDPVARKTLENILHPAIREESWKKILAHDGTGPVVYEAALLVETGRYQEMDGLIVVDAADDIRLDRLVERDGIIPETALQMLTAQATNEERLSHATVIIHNNGTLQELEREVAHLVQILKTQL